MGIIEIGLLVAGVACFVISFFVSEKLSPSDLSEFEKMSENEMRIIVERQLREADGGIKKMIDEGMEDAMEDFEAKADKLLNSKIISISDYSNSVLASMEKSHQEVVFMYNMLLEKQKTLTELTRDIQMLESNLREIKANIEDSDRIEDIKEIVSQIEVIEEAKDIRKIESVDASSMAEVLSDEVKLSDEQENVSKQNDKIIKMHNEGFSEVEIAKRLGRGLGEIKLVLGLFDKE